MSPKTDGERRRNGKAGRRLLHGLRLLATVPIFLYQKVISPMKPASCIYVPSCSSYARESILRHGVLKGTLAGTARLLRCSGGLFTGGYDPVPEEASFNRIRNDFRRFRRTRKRGEESQDT